MTVTLEGNDCCNSLTEQYALCSVQSRNLRHLEITLHSLRIQKLHANLEVVQNICAISG